LKVDSAKIISRATVAVALCLILMPLNIFSPDFWRNTSSPNLYLFGISPAHADQKTNRTTRCTLTTMRGGRHERYASIVFQFSEQIQLQTFSIENREIRFRLNNVTTSLNSFRKYKTIDSWVKLKKVENDLEVRIGFPEDFKTYNTLMIDKPHRLVVNLYDSKPRETIRDKKKQPRFRVAPDNAKAESKIIVTSVETPPRPAAKESPIVLVDKKQMELIEARIFSRQGLYEKSLKIYQSLRRRYPQDEEVWEDYIETLVNYADYDLALEELNRLFKKNPSSLRGQRIQAQIFNELRQYRWSYPIYENIISQYQKDAGLWADYANARQEAGEWAAALNYYCRVIELDPENTAALRSVHDILREHRPRLETGYRDNIQEGGNTHTKTLAVHYTAPLGRRTSLDVAYDRIDIQRSQQPDIAAVDQSVDDFMTRLHHGLGRDWQVTVGGGTYRGLGDRNSFLFGFDYRIDTSAQLQADYARHRPWYDPIEAANFKGYFNRGTVRFDKSFDGAWGLYLEASQYDYVVNDVTNYGRKRTFTGILSRRVSEHPDLSVSYSFYRSAFGYDNVNFAPVPMIESESVHSLNLALEHWLCTYWACSLTGGLRRDTSRSIRSWYFSPGLKIRFGNRVEAELNYEYSSEAQTAGGGETETLNIRARIIL